MEYIEEINEYFDDQLKSMSEHVTIPFNEYIDAFNENMQRKVIDNYIINRKDYIRNYEKKPGYCSAVKSLEQLNEHAKYASFLRQRYYKQNIVITDIDELPDWTISPIKRRHEYNQNSLNGN